MDRIRSMRSCYFSRIHNQPELTLSCEVVTSPSKEGGKSQHSVTTTTCEKSQLLHNYSQPQKELFARQRLKTYKRKPKARDFKEQVAALIDFYRERRPKAKTQNSKIFKCGRVRGGARLVFDSEGVGIQRTPRGGHSRAASLPCKTGRVVRNT